MATCVIMVLLELRRKTTEVKWTFKELRSTVETNEEVEAEETDKSENQDENNETSEEDKNEENSEETAAEEESHA